MQSALGLEVPAETTAGFNGSVHDSQTARKALDDLTSRALAYSTGPELKALFDFMKRFPHLAAYNAMLLHVQNPSIQFALRAPVWEQKYERQVKPAARPYVILQTMGPVTFVFDLSDTNPINPKRDLIPEIIRNPFAANGQPPPGALKKLIIACLKIGIVVQEQNLPTNHAGGVIRFCDGKFAVTLNAKHSEAQRIGTAAHELGHIFCGHLGAVKDGFWPDKSNATKGAREFEAEAVAYLVTDRLNLEIGSVRYLGGYLSGEKRLPNYSLDTVLKAVNKIEEMLRGRFRIRRPPVGIAANARN